MWGAHVPSIKQTYGLNEGSLSLVLFSAALGAVLSLFLAGRMIGRLGPRVAALRTGLLLAASLALALHWPGVAGLMAGSLVFGASMSIFDVAINAEGTALEKVGGRPVMGNLHGCFSLGAMGGAVLAAGLLKAATPAAWQLGLMGGLVAGLVALASRAMLDARPGAEAVGADGEPRHFAWPRGLLLVIGLLIFAGMTAEGVMYDWCVLYLAQELAMPQHQAALGYAAFVGAMAAARFGGDFLRARLPEHQLLMGSAGLAALAMAVVLLAGHPVVALIGYGLVGLGLAPVVPILYTAASKMPGTSSAAAIAAASSIGYSGFLIGPPLIGGIAQAVSLTAAMGVVVLATLALTLGARCITTASASN
jgi:fucose permease